MIALSILKRVVITLGLYWGCNHEEVQRVAAVPSLVVVGRDASVVHASGVNVVVVSAGVGAGWDALGMARFASDPNGTTGVFALSGETHVCSLGVVENGVGMLVYGTGALL